jgi:hypothetical protein
MALTLPQVTEDSLYSVAQGRKLLPCVMEKIITHTKHLKTEKIKQETEKLNKEFPDQQ